MSAMATAKSSPATSPGASGRASYRGPFALMTVLFFMWGFMTVWNDILIPHFREAFTLSYFQAMLVQFAFFGAYAIGSLFYYIISVIWGDPINRIGYQNGVVAGLLLAAVGSGLFVPAAMVESYPFFLTALFILGLGFTMLQIAANPYVTILGPEITASSRLNLSQAFNSFGTTIGPVVGGWLIFTVFSRARGHSADAVKVPYLCCAVIFVLMALLFKFVKLPHFSNSDAMERGPGALSHLHTRLGMLAIFMYVGGEVAVGSAIVNFLGAPQIGGLTVGEASRYLSYYWGGLMIGRFMGAFALSELNPRAKFLLTLLVPLLAWLLVWRLGGTAVALPYGAMLLLLLVAFGVGGATPARMLTLFSVLIIGLLTAGMLGTGQVATWAILGIGLFCSVMWSNIFSLAIEGLGRLKSQASSLLIMAILGGAILPPVQGLVADHFGIQVSFVVPMIAFAYVAFYGAAGCRMGRTPSFVEKVVQA